MARGGSGIDISLIGDEKLIREFNDLPGKLQKKVFRKAVRKAAKPVLAEAKRLVPVDTGFLRKSLKIRANKRSRKTVGVQIVTGEGFFKGEAFYGAFVELGTKRQRPIPYLRSALKNKEAEALNVLRIELKAGIEANA